MIPEIRTGILGVDMGPVDCDDEQLDAEEKQDKDVGYVYLFMELSGALLHFLSRCQWILLQKIGC